MYAGFLANLTLGKTGQLSQSLGTCHNAPIFVDLTLKLDIMIHGTAVSIGCIAVGDVAIEEVFVLAADVGREHVGVVLSPLDLRASPLPAALASAHPWSRDLYARIRAALAALPPPATP